MPDDSPPAPQGALGLAPLGPRPLIASADDARQVRRLLLFRQFSILLLTLATFWLLHSFLPENLPPALDILIDFGVVVVAIMTSSLLAYRAGAREAEVLRSSASILGSLPVGVALVDRDFRITYVNPALARLLGVPASGLHGKDTLAFTATASVGRVKAERTGRQAGHASSYRRDMLRADGAAVPTLMAALPFVRGATFDGELLAFIDLSDLAEAEDRAHHFQKLSGFLFDAVTHDLSNSLQNVLGLVQVAEARTGPNDPGGAAVLSRAAAAATRAAELIREVKLIAAAEGANWPQEPRALGSLVERAIEMARVPAPVRVAAKMSPANAARTTPVNELASMALAKLIEEAADCDVQEKASPDLVVEVRSGPAAENRADFVVRGCRRQYRPEDIAGALAAPASRRVGETLWRSGVKLALASAIGEAHGWTLHAEPEDGGTEFSLRGLVLDGAA